MDVCRDGSAAVVEVERLRELAVEQQEVIEYLRQALKERERKLDQLSNKKRKEEFYKQWLELEPVAEVDDEEEHEEGDSALSSAPSSLSPQPEVWHTNGLTRDTYESLLLEVDDLQTKYLVEHQELIHAKSQVRELERALLQETRGSQNSRRALSDKLHNAEEREASLIAELSELREQNELLEFRVLELEETGSRESPDNADSGIVSPEPNHLFKDSGNKRRDRAVATVIPYNSYSQSILPIIGQKSPLSLQESGIFEDEDNEHVELTSCGTQTETPAGELLQEVQRLQELRERIQERASKVSPQLEIYENFEDNRSYKERIRQLEERLCGFKDTEGKRSQDQLEAKQREEDLLDENYRLTERVYLLKNELQQVCEVKKKLVDVGTMTNLFIRDFALTKNFNLINLRSQMLLQNCSENLEDGNTRRKTAALQPCRTGDLMRDCLECESLRNNYDEIIQHLARAESSYRQQIINLKQKEEALSKTLQQEEATWMQLEIDHVDSLDKIKCQLTETMVINQKMKQRISELENFMKRGLNSSMKNNQAEEAMEAMDVDDVDCACRAVNRISQPEEIAETNFNSKKNMVRI